MGSARKGSNPLGLGEHLGPQSFLGICPQRFESPRAWRASRPPKLPPLPGTPRSREHWRGRFAETGSIGGSALPRRGRVCSSRLPLGCAGLADLLSYEKKEKPIFLETCTSPQVCPSGERLAETGARLLFSSPVGLRGTCGLVKLLEKRKTRSSLRLAQVRKSALLGGAALLVSFWSVLSGPAAQGRLAALQRRGPFLFKNCGKQVIPIGTAPWEARTPDLEVDSLTL